MLEAGDTMVATADLTAILYCRDSHQLNRSLLVTTKEPFDRAWAKAIYMARDTVLQEKNYKNSFIQSIQSIQQIRIGVHMCWVLEIE